MSHTGLPSRAYVENYMSFIDKEPMLKRRTELKNMLVENGYRLNDITRKLYTLHKVRIVSDIKDKIEEDGLDIKALMKENSNSSREILRDLFSDFIYTQTHPSVVIWNVHFGLDNELETAALYTMLYVEANYIAVDKLLRIRRHNLLEITEEMKHIENIVRHIRNINKYMIYGDLKTALENLEWCKENCPDAKDIDLWDFRLSVCMAESDDDIKNCFDKLNALENREDQDYNQYLIKAYADLLWKAGDEAEAKEKEAKDSNDGLILLDISEKGRI